MSHTSKSVVKYIHLYVWGSVAVSLNEDAYYFVNLINNFSKMTQIILGSTSQEFSHL